jgi:hypothetical protein
METIEHHHHYHDNPIKLLFDKVVGMFQKNDHTLGEFLLLYALIFAAILVFLVMSDLLFKFDV